MKTIKYKGEEYELVKYTSCKDCELKKQCDANIICKFTSICGFIYMPSDKMPGKKVNPLRLKWKYFFFSLLIAAAIIVSFLIIIWAGFRK